MIHKLILAAGVSASAATAVPLEFGSLNGRDIYANNAPGLACEKSLCRLDRTELGGIPIEYSSVLRNDAGRITRIYIATYKGNGQDVITLLTTRYGPPALAIPGTTLWPKFDEGAELSASTTAENMVVTFDFPANQVRRELKPDF